MNYINLSNLQLKTFTEQDASDYCQLNSINHDKIIKLMLDNNKLTDISGVKLFKNLRQLYLNNNKIKDISVLKDLNSLKILSIINLELESDQIQYIKSLKKLKELYPYKGFKDMTALLNTIK